MRIAHVTDFYLPRLGGIELHVHDLATRQRAAGHTVEIVTSSPRGAATRGTPEHHDGLRVHRLTETAAHPSPFHPAGLAAGRRLVRERHYDVVHVHAGLVSPLAFGVTAAAASSGVPVVLTAHSLVSYLEPVFRLLAVGTGWTSWPVVWTAVSDVAAVPLRRMIGARREVLVLPNGVDPATWRVDPLPRDPTDVLVVAVMRLAPRKRPIHLLRMLAQVGERVAPAVRLRAVIVGEGPERRSLERFLRRHRMTEWVSLPGRWSRDQIRSLFARADLFVAPATLESFGIAALEARCAGLPVVARTQGGIGEFIIDGRDGFLVDSDDAMADAMTRLVSVPGEREAIAAHNRAVLPTVTWKDVVRRTDAAYSRAIDMVRPAQQPRARLDAAG